MNIYQKLNVAREKFHATELKKTGHNKFADYYYFELSDFLIPALGIFKELELCAVVSFQELIATMTITNIDKPEEQIFITSPMGSAKLKACHEVQNIGAVETYQRRYLWVAAFEIVEHDAVDSSEGIAKIDVSAILKGISGAMTVDLLKTNYEAAILMLDKETHAAINKAKNTRYHELTKKA